MTGFPVAQVVIPKETHRRLKALAAARGQTLYQLVTAILEEYLKLREKEGTESDECEEKPTVATLLPTVQRFPHERT